MTSKIILIAMCITTICGAFGMDANEYLQSGDSLSSETNIKKYVYDGYDKEAKNRVHDSIVERIKLVEEIDTCLYQQYVDFLQHCEKGNFEEIIKPFYESTYLDKEADILCSVFLCGIHKAQCDYNAPDVRLINQKRILEIFGETHGEVIWDEVKRLKKDM